jgi:hypothetical protein
MGLYIKNEKTGETIKIGSCERSFYRRETLQKYKEEGYVGYENGEYNESLDEFINDSNTIYTLDNENEYNSIRDDVKFFFKTNGMEHQKVTIFHHGYRYDGLQCQFDGEKYFKAVYIGEIHDNASRNVRTVFACDCCNRYFSVGHTSAMLLRNLLPEYKQLFHSEEDCKFEEDLNLEECLEIVAEDSETFGDFLNQIRIDISFKRIKQEVKKFGYPTMFNFFYECRKIVSQEK